MEKYRRNEASGITLIALIVTIIVILILAGISISMVTGDNGILKNAGIAKENTEKFRIVEQIRSEILSKQRKGFDDITEEELKEILLKYGTLSGNDVGILSQILTTTDGSYEITVSEIYDGTFGASSILSAGLYNADTNEQIYDWNRLLALGNFIAVNGETLVRAQNISVPENVQRLKLVITDDGSVTTIGVLQAMPKLKEVVIPAVVTQLSNNAIFAGNQDLEKVTFASNSRITSIPQNCFPDVRSLKSINIPNSVTSIGNYAFGGCSSLTSINLPNNVTSIGDAAFKDCTSLVSINLSNSLVSIGNSTFQNCTAFKGPLNLPNTITTIGNSAFYSCSSLSGNLVIPNSVTSIGSSAFGGCSKLNGTLEIDMTNIPDNFYNNVFKDINDVKSVLTKLKIGNHVTSIGNMAFSGCAGFTGNLIIPQSVTTIGNTAFADCTGFTGELIIPQSVTSIWNGAFYGCTGFTGELIIPNTVTKLGAGAFNRCTGFNGRLVIPQNLTTIENGVFSDCTGFTGDLTIPHNITTIEPAAFKNCSGFTSITIKNTQANVTVGNDAFLNTVSVVYNP